ncbi:hypothetical protein DRB17_10305 [Ferruginivarius sediminum]|uniref:Uncharacterized protein n=2 Tax=Ferruginivarius sediminum TaxID=2661937 RepID=A0A369TG52_9PROT|nr:hypothetical protein DRB17_10305 [Ferruginivarius sediminum]
MSDDFDRAGEVGGSREGGRGPKDVWDKIRATGTALVALVVGVTGYMFNSWQSELNRDSAEMRFYTDLLAQREQADSDIRAKMFNTLFNAYFGGQLAAGSDEEAAAAGEDASAAPARTTLTTVRDIHNRIMFLDLLARNFEGIDIRPLFEDLNQYLTDIWKGARADVSIGRAEAFREREILRRAARGVVDRQTAYLQGLEGTRVESVRIEQHPCDAKPKVVEWGDNAGKLGLYVKPDHMADGVVSVVLRPDRQAYEAAFDVTFFDMPIIENFQLPDGRRMAVTLEKYFSPSEYGDYGHLLPDARLREDYEFIDSSELCRSAVLRFIRFSDIYIGPRDRPLIEELITSTLDSTADTADTAAE